MSSQLGGPWLVLAVGIAASVAAIVAGQLRLGGYLLAATFALTGAVRLALPTRAVGAVAVRSRTVDVIGLLLTAVAAAVLTYTLKTTP